MTATMRALVCSGLLATCPVAVTAQRSDSLQVGDLVRVRVGVQPANGAILVGHVGRLLPDTLEIALPRDAGSIVLPRNGIHALERFRGTEWSRPNAVGALPLFVASAAMTVLLIRHPPASTTTRVASYLSVGLSVPAIAMHFRARPLQKWEPASSWLENR